MAACSLKSAFAASMSLAIQTLLSMTFGPSALAPFERSRSKRFRANLPYLSDPSSAMN